MSNITFKKTTRTNNDFQSTLKRMLRDFNCNFNDDLELAQTDDRAVIIRYAHEPFKPSSANNENRKVYHLYNDYEKEHEFLSLTPDQFRLLKWLSQEEFISCDWEWEEMGKMTVKEI